MGIGLPELLLVLVICFVIFGAGKLPEVGNALGKSIAEYKKASKEVESSTKNVNKEQNQ